MEDLTPSEEALLDFIRQGKPDAEIAVRLGVPTGEVKRRVAAVMVKTRSADREALKTYTWADSGAEVDADSAETPVESSVHRLPAWLQATVSLLVVSAVVLLALWVLVRTRGGPSRAEAVVDRAASAVAATGTALPTLAPTPTATSPISAQPEHFTVNGNGFDVFDSTILVTASCAPQQSTACPDVERLLRATRPYGLPSDFELEPIEVPQVSPGQRQIGIASDLRGWRIAVSECIEPDPDDCTRLWPNIHSVVLYSEDGGVTWTQLGESFARQARPVLISSEGVVTQIYFSSRPNEDPRPIYRILTPHGAVEDAVAGDLWVPVGTLADGRSAWAVPDAQARILEFDSTTLYDSAGHAIVALKIPKGSVVHAVFPLFNESLLVTWTGPGGEHGAGLALEGQIIRHFDNWPFWPDGGIPLEGNLLLGTGQDGVAPLDRFLTSLLDGTPGPWTPVLVLSTASHSLYRISKGFDVPELDQRQLRILAARPGPQLRIAAAVNGSCVPVTSSPGGQGQLLGCFAPGVLLDDIGFDEANLTREEMELAGESWIRVGWPGPPGSDEVTGWTNSANIVPESTLSAR